VARAGSWRELSEDGDGQEERAATTVRSLPSPLIVTMGTVLSRNNRTVPAQPTTTAVAPTAASNDTQPPTPSTSSLPSPSTIPLASSDAPTPSTSSLTPALPPVVHVNTQIRDPTSKSALKKAAKQAAYDAAKPARRLKDKLKKKEKAEGKRKAYEMGETEGGGGKKARTKTMMPWNVRVVLDLGFDELMTENVRNLSSSPRDRA
jgi:hypothetical protein